MGTESSGPSSLSFRIKLFMQQHIQMYVIVFGYCLFFRRSPMEALVYTVIIVINSISFIRASLTNPGYVGKKSCHRYTAAPVRFGGAIATEIAVNSGNDWVRKIRIEDVEYEEKYCQECNVFRIEGMAHCRECDRCVLEMDHHCVWFDNCIGRNNIKLFHIYLYSLTVLCGLCAYFLSRIGGEVPHDTMRSRLVKVLVNLLCIGYSLAFALVASFALYNLFLVLYSTRSRDFIKGLRRNKVIDLDAVYSNMSTLKPFIGLREFGV
jgi:palmitoyltransferase ZDHHC9/14/18